MGGGEVRRCGLFLNDFMSWESSTPGKASARDRVQLYLRHVIIIIIGMPYNPPNTSEK